MIKAINCDKRSEYATFLPEVHLQYSHAPVKLTLLDNDTPHAAFEANWN